MKINDPIDDFYFLLKTDSNINYFNYYLPIENENESNLYYNLYSFSADLNLETDNYNKLFTYSSLQYNDNYITHKVTKKLLGRKKKDSGEIGFHNKYSENNRIRKFKVIIKDALLDLINSKIKEVINLTLLIDQKEFVVDGLLNIRQSQIISTNVIDNRELLNKTFREIFSDEIAKNYKRYPKNYNKIVIDKIYEIESGKEIAHILDMKFIDCIRYFRKDKNYMNDERFFYLKGLEKKFENLSKVLSAEGNDEKYIKMLFDLIYNFEKIISEKKSRKKKKK